MRVQAIRTFTSTATTSAGELDLSLQRDSDLIATARTLIETTPSLTNAEFARWFRLLGTRSSYPGSFGLIYIESVKAANLPRFEARVATDPPLGLPLRGPFNIEPKDALSSYCLTRAGVVQLPQGIPISSFSSVLSFTQPDLDYCALPIGNLLRETALAGTPTAVTIASLLASSPSISGVPAAPSQLPALLANSDLVATITPIYVKGVLPTTASSRRQSLRGWVLGVDQGDNILSPSVAGHRGLTAILGYSSPSGARTVLARTGPIARGSLTRTFRLSAPGQWTVTLAEPLPVGGLSPLTQGLVVLLAGLLVSLLFFLLITVLSRSRARALQLVEKRTAQLLHQALHDGLTQLPNRELIFDRADQMLARARRDHTEVAALFIDLDQFKDVNDTFGHSAGDELLRQTAARFSATVRETDTVGRLGGDEFVVLLESTLGSPAPELVAENLIASLKEPFRLGNDGRTLTTISASIGIALGMRDTSGELLRDADIALYQAKATARGHYVIFETQMHAGITARLELETAASRSPQGRSVLPCIPTDRYSVGLHDRGSRGALALAPSEAWRRDAERVRSGARSDRDDP